MQRADGGPRRAGFEIEMHGMKPQRVTELVQEHFGGTVVEKNPYVYSIDDTEFGSFRVELDARYLTELEYRKLMSQAGIESHTTIAEMIENFLKDVAEFWVPCEVVCPPIPIDQLSRLLGLEKVLRFEGAVGSTASLFHALGLQINAEVPDLECATLLSYLRAFLEKYEWLEKEVDVDLARRVTSYVAPFESDYVELTLDPSYRPTMTEFIDDYLEHNPTRNRALDMLPVLAHVDEDRVMARAKEPELIKPRPALHYRLPSCRLDDNTWSMATEWNRWVEVERRAEYWLGLASES